MGVPVAALVLVIVLALSFPLALISRVLQLDHFFYSIAGFCFLLFNYQYDAFWILLSVVSTWTVQRVLGRSKVMLLLTCVGNFLFLLAGYWFYESEEYDINWTTPQCVMTLRLIAAVVDFYDGGKTVQTKDENENSVSEMPSFSVFGFVLRFRSFLRTAFFSRLS